jgi:hypothetical protein
MWRATIIQLTPGNNRLTLQDYFVFLRRVSVTLTVATRDAQSTSNSHTILDPILLRPIFELACSIREWQFDFKRSLYLNINRARKPWRTIPPVRRELSQCHKTHPRFIAALASPRNRRDQMLRKPQQSEMKWPSAVIVANDQVYSGSRGS